MKKFTFCCVLLISTFIVQAQYLVEAEKVKTSNSGILLGSYDVDSYKITYNTEDVLGEPTTATGLLSIPLDATRAFPLLASQHGTVDGPSDVPSNLEGGYALGENGASTGYITVQADYLGLGDNVAIHPYVHARSEATAARDLMRAAREFIGNNSDIHMNDQVFITGYSQGGHGALALHKLLEQEHDDEFEVTASAPMSGPYSISKEMIDFTLGDDDYNFCAYIVWSTMSMIAAYPDLLKDYEIENIFKPEYMDDINSFRNGDIGLFTLNNLLINDLVANFGRVTPKDLLFEDILDAVKNDPTHPLSIALQRNDLDDWAPTAPTRLMYCTADDQVTFRNAITAESKMNALGAVDLEAVENGVTLNHGACVSPATTSTILFFFGFREIGMVSGVEVVNDFREIKYYQNSEFLHYELNQQVDLGNQAAIEFYDMNGSFVKSVSIDQHKAKVSVENIGTGMYIIAVKGETGYLQFQKLFIL